MNRYFPGSPAVCSRPSARGNPAMKVLDGCPCVGGGLINENLLRPDPTRRGIIYTWREPSRRDQRRPGRHGAGRPPDGGREEAWD